MADDLGSRPNRYPLAAGDWTAKVFLEKDGDGIADGTDDANHDGYRQAGERDMIIRDTDADGIQGGSETHSYDKIGRLTSTAGSSRWGALS